ncbi:MAG: LD-carboxypeptidase [Bdellovibrionales bacterium]|nr:LD-carboxypeptidase [Bdellovibrionales bacterium]
MARQKGMDALKPGDIVDIVAPGMPPMPGTISGAKQFLYSWGLVPRIAKDIIRPQVVCANTRKYRQLSLSKALLAKDSKMVWCLRGGYGSHQLLQGLAKVKPGPAKIFMGLSDITSLHLFLQDQWGWETIHGPNIDRFANHRAKASEVKYFFDVLFGKKNEVVHKLKPLNPAAKKLKTLRAPITGGNLITLQATLGTPFQLKTKGKILFIEDIGERAYRVNRVLEHLEQAGAMQGVKAILLGQFTGGKEPNGKHILPRFFKEYAEEIKVPLFSGVVSGHGDPQRPVIFGRKSQIIGGKRPILVSSTGLCGE